MDIPLDALSKTALIAGRMGITYVNIVNETLQLLGDKDKQMLYLYYFKQLSQEEISKKLNVPIGTVKSRLSFWNIKL